MLYFCESSESEVFIRKDVSDNLVDRSPVPPSLPQVDLGARCFSTGVCLKKHVGNVFGVERGLRDEMFEDRVNKLI